MVQIGANKMSLYSIGKLLKYMLEIDRDRNVDVIRTSSEIFLLKLPNLYSCMLVYTYIWYITNIGVIYFFSLWMHASVLPGFEGTMMLFHISC